MPQQTRTPFAPVHDAIATGQKKIKINGLSQSARALFLSSIARSGTPFCLITSSNDHARLLFEELSFFMTLEPAEDDTAIKPLFFPPWDILPYEPSTPRPDWIAQRLSALHKLALKETYALVTTLDGFLQGVVEKSLLLSSSEILRVGEIVPREALIKRLARAGYEGTTAVTSAGEISLRGGIVDLYAPTNNSPVRIEFFDDEIESIRTFDPETQRSEEEIESVQIILGRENIFNKQHHASLLSDYLSPETVLIFDEPNELLQNGKRFLEEAEDASVFASTRNTGYPTVKSLYAPLSHLIDATENRTAIDIETLFMKAEKGAIRFTYEPRSLTALGFSRPGQNFSEACQLLDKRRQTEIILLIVKNEHQAERFRRLLTDHELPWANWNVKTTKDLSPPAPILIKIGSISEGFALEGSKIVFLTEEALTGGGKLGGHHPSSASKRSIEKSKQAGFLASFEELKPGDHVVHMDHGVGKYIGLKRLTIRQGERDKGYESDFLVLEYLSRDKVYVPLDSLNLVQRYIGMGGGSPKIDKLGGARWAKTKARVKTEIKEMTQELLELYAEREVLEGHAFATAASDAEAFAAAFEYEETPDQLRTIQEVLADMEKAKPMDRLVCGDVGYGKTEVAMRAAFQAVMDNKQVAIVVPTTLLAQQHYESFVERFAPFPVNVSVLSRFVSRPEQRTSLASLKKGTIDILIGTHRLLQKDVIFKDLGLIVVDEEHRFGVRHKEWLKKMRKEVDVLTLTATPIPRTLQMSLAQVRDLSVIETPPADRLAIRTIMAPFDPTIIREVVFRELVRGGQVFFLHNRVHNIEKIALFLGELLPEAKIGIAHGQMAEGALEKVMRKFIDKEYNLLLTTTIIESGIDIPSANTIIINDADRFGLSELYQLRGRVGRSGEQAYAYLLVREDRILTEDAKQRLHAIQEFTELGSGFKVAARDLEIRGAGNLLGQEQSGQIAAVGFELYLEMINELVTNLKGTPIEKKIETTLHFRVSAFIPEDYITDPLQRLSTYKRLSRCENLDEIQAIRLELEDRYGPLPAPASQLLQVIQLKGMAKTLKMSKIEERGKNIRFSFEESNAAPSIDPGALLQQFPGRIQFITPYAFELAIKNNTWENIYLETALCLKNLSCETPA
ncbi:MAG: transcription-repair coupling factor [Nitrospirae bacterium]|nr:transcription-repair coupling factor [Candidatus Manganitrophaceae bacterium]